MSSEESSARSRSKSRKLLRRLLRLALEYKRPCAVVIVLHTILVALSLSTLGLTGLGIDFLSSQVVSGATAPKWPFGFGPSATTDPFRVIVALSAVIFVVACVTAALKYYAAVASAVLSQSILIRVRTELYEKLQQLDFRYYDAGESSSIINRAAGDANNVRNFVDGVIIRVLTVTLTLTVYLIYMLRMHIGLTLACLASTPLLWIGAVVFSRLVQPAYRRASELGDVMIRTLVENLQGIQVVKGFAREPEQAERFGAANGQIRDLKGSIFFRISTFQPAMGLLTQLNMLVLIGYGGTLVIRGELALGAGLFVFANLLHEFANQVSHITNIANSIQASLVSAERVFEVLDEPLRITSSPTAIGIKAIERSIEFKDVSFAYESGKPVLSNVSLTIRRGEQIGIMGPTGSGKSTLLLLMKRFYDVSSGTVLIDGVDVRNIQLDDLRRAIGLVMQDNFLFSNTVSANVSFGEIAVTHDRVVSAAQTAAADEFIQELPQKYDSLVGEHGSNLSGGQRQRLSLARTLLCEPSVLMLDDATASVDSETEEEIRAAMAEASRGRTAVVVSNRISTLRELDRIVVLFAGRVEAVGNHEDLLSTSETYRRVAALQAGIDGD